MLLFKEDNVAYIHVPKTSGKALRSLLIHRMRPSGWWGTVEAVGAERARFDRVDRSHYTAEMVREFRPGLWRMLLGMTCFSVARSPYSRAVSAYEEFQRQFAGHDVVRRVRSLSGYLSCVEDELYRRDRDGYMYIHGAPQTRFHLPGHRVIFGDDMTDSLSSLFGRRLVFRSLERPCRSLSREETKMVDRIYADDIAIWNSLTVGGGSVIPVG
jgi:hypothetical protein